MRGGVDHLALIINHIGIRKFQIPMSVDNIWRGNIDVIMKCL